MDDIDLHMEVVIPLEAKMDSVEVNFAEEPRLPADFSKRVEKLRIIAAHKEELEAVWKKRVAAYRKLQDSTDPREVHRLSREYFAAIEEYQILFRRYNGSK